MLPEHREHLAAAKLLAAAKDDDALVFASRKGGLLNQANVNRSWLKPAAKAAGLPSDGFHALRRSYAMALEARRLGVVDQAGLLAHSAAAMVRHYQDHDTGEARLERLRRAVEG